MAQRNFIKLLSTNCLSANYCIFLICIYSIITRVLLCLHFDFSDFFPASTRLHDKTVGQNYNNYLNTNYT